MVRTLKGMLLSVMFITFIYHYSIIKPNFNHDINAQNTEKTTTNISELNKLVIKTSECLDKISSVLEFTAQAINKGSIVLPNKTAAKKWINNNLNNIKTLEDSLNKFDINIVDIYKISCVSKFLIAHIHCQFDQELKKIRDFVIDLDAIKLKNAQISKITPHITNQLININLKKVLKLQEKANEIGLTAFNKVARKIDQLNDKYQITKILNIIPLLVLVSIPIIYYAPFRWFGLKIDKNGIISETNQSLGWFSKIPFFNRLKSIKKYTGASKYTDRKSHMNLKETGNGLLHVILSICDHDFGKISLAFNAIAAYINKDTLATNFPQIGDFLSTSRNFWQGLKGYEVKNSSRYQIIENLTLDDERIIGLGSQKEELGNALEYIANPEMYDKQNSGPSKAMIIVGPSGNGKTLLAKAVAGSLNKLLKDKGSNNRIAFKEIKWTEIAWTREGLKKVVEQAKAHAPCILFFDEIHTLPLQTKEGSPTLSDLLTELDGVNAENSSSNQIIFLAATNQPEMLDSALLRSGRFGTIIRVKKPNFEARRKYFEVMCKRYSIDIASIDLNLLARQTRHCSYSDLDTILKDARFTARREVRRTNQKHIQDRIIKRIYRLTDEEELTDYERKHLAANKAGSSLMYLLLDPQEKLEIVTIKGHWKKIKESRYWDNDIRKKQANTKNIKYGAIFTYNPNEALEVIDDHEKIKQCKIRMAGYLAEEILLKCRITKISKADDKFSPQKNKLKALELIKSTLYDSSEENYMSKKMKQELKEKTYEIFKQYEHEVKETLIQNHSLLTKIAAKLEDEELLTAKDLQELVAECAII